MSYNDAGYPQQQQQYGQQPVPYGQQAPYGQQPQYAPVPPPQQQYAGPRKSVTKERKRTSHGLHLVLTICTAGAWGLLVWLPLTMWHKIGPRRRVVTKHR